MPVHKAQSVAHDDLMWALESQSIEVRAHVPGKGIAAIAQHASLFIRIPCKLQSQAERVNGILVLRRHTSSRL